MAAGLSWSPPVFKPIVYVPASRESLTLSKKVQLIQVCAHEAPNEGAQHWVIYLNTGGNESVCINMQPSYSQPASAMPGGSKGIMIVSLLQCDASDITVQNYSFLPSHENTTVGDMIRRLTDHGRERYDFTAEGTGCRKWISSTLNLWAQHGFLTSNNANVSKTYIEKHWPGGNPNPVAGGGYY